MFNFVSSFRVPLLLLALLIASTSPNAYNENILANFLKKIMNSYLPTNQSSTVMPKFRSNYDTVTAGVEDLIRLKIIELKPMLQDDEHYDNTAETEHHLELQGNNDTTIIEFVPKISRKTKVRSPFKETKDEIDTFKKNIGKYKQLKHNIMKLLDKEKTAKSTKVLIGRTLDEMLAQLLERQCTWKSIDTEILKDHLFGSRANVRKSMEKLKTLSDENWMSLRKQYEKFLEFHAGKQSEFMSAFQDYFLGFFNVTSNLAENYKIRCQLIKLDDSSGDKAIGVNGKRDNNECNNFKVCSEELINFFNNTYNHLNHTAVSIFRNYAAMYVRDVQQVMTSTVNDDVTIILERMSNSAEKEVKNQFVERMSNFSLDENKDKGSNVQLLKKFITDTTDEIQITLKMLMENELKGTINSLFTTVEHDLNVNLKVEMNDLSRTLQDKMCKFFVLCNSRVFGTIKSRRRAYIPDDSENVFVKVQLTFDDELKNSLNDLRLQKAWPGDLTRRLVQSFVGFNMSEISSTARSDNNEIGLED